MKRTALAPILAALLLSPGAAAQEVKLDGRPLIEVAQQLKPGQFIWVPEHDSAGPALAVVNLETQRMMFFRNGIPVGASTISSGKAGHETPTGVFTILQKREKHFSKTYNNAPMPNMQRLTWEGIALHAGNLPGYPASHGCIRLPMAFSKLLFAETSLGMTVVITSLPDAPHETDPPDVLQDGVPSREAIDNARYEWHPERAPSLNGDAIVAVVISKADHRAIVMKGGVEIGSAPVYVRGGDAGAEAYVLEKWDSTGQHWSKLRFSENVAGSASAAGAGEQFDTPAEFRRVVRAAMRPGSVVVITPASLRSGKPGRSQTVIETEGG